MYSVEKFQGVNLVKHFDYFLFFAVLILSGIGIVVVKSASLVMPNGADGSRMAMVQVAAMVLGIVAALVLSSIDYQYYKNFSFILYLGSLMLLVLVLIFGTGEQFGSKSWLNIAGITVQPSELAKISFVFVVAYYLEKINESEEKIKPIALLAVFAAIPIGLVLLQPDMGTALVFIFIFCIMVYVAGLSYKYIAIGFLSSIPVFLLSWFYLLEDYQKNRIIGLFKPESGSTTYTFNVLRSIMAIGSGRLYGQGLFQGTLTQSASVPVKESDFIFSVIGEELGFIGSVAVVLLLTLIIIRCLYIAKTARDKFGSYVVSGICGMYAFHFIENTGMSIGLLPVTGIPLPFISQGGTSLLASFIAIGVVLSVSMRRKKALFEDE
ncbi:MAG TPA: rod shape-determining protein RodA [Clostridiaceae bacterium]|jgi:rod shape determining protein RodA|nr:rod shape-determining protein RodA [Clostridiaceae bacterium]